MKRNNELNQYKILHNTHIQNINPNIEAIEYTNSHSLAKYRCKKCGKEFTILPSSLRRREYRCPVCEQKNTAHPKLTLAEYRPDLISWLEHPNDAYKYGFTSSHKITIICPICYTREVVSIRNFAKRVYPCQACNKDGISYPNKFLREFLKEINSQVSLKETEWNPEWAEDYKYDGHIITKDSIDYIIEMHGIQHYEQTSMWDFEYQKQRDLAKSDLAVKHNIEQIIIECKVSDFNYIKSHILESKLSELLNLSNINWASIAQRAAIDYTKVAADYYNQNIGITEIGKLLMIDRHTVSRLLKEATIAEWCHYEPISCVELNKINVKIINIKTNVSRIIHGVQEACNFIYEDSGYKIDRHTMQDYVKGFYYSYFYTPRKKISLEGKIYKDTYKFEYLDKQESEGE